MPLDTPAIRLIVPGTTKSMISSWFDREVELEATHMLIVCDTFEYEDFPVYVSSDEWVIERVDYYRNQRMHKVMEVYNLGQDKDSQLSEDRAFNTNYLENQNITRCIPSMGRAKDYLF